MARKQQQQTQTKTEIAFKHLCRRSEGLLTSVRQFHHPPHKNPFSGLLDALKTILNADVNAKQEKSTDKQ